MKKLLLAIALLTTQVSMASTVDTRTDTLNFIHMRLDHWQEVYGLHNVHITNDTSINHSYHFIFKVCVENWKCTSHEGDIDLQPGQSSSFGDKVILRYFGSQPVKVGTHAETIVMGDGYWHSEKNGTLEVEG